MTSVRQLLTALTLTVSLTSFCSAADKETPAVLNHKVNSLAGKPVALSEYEGKVLLIVNVASECGATPQYAPLQKLYEEYKDQGLVVLGFPCNQFGAQEPGDAKEIQTFCETKYRVSFPMFEKIDVNGPNASPLYQHLTSEKTDPKFAGKVKWNFEKFLIGKNGEIVGRFGTGVEPDDETIVSQIKAELAK
ncbi:glutathione peroxidase [Planctomicrobium sp. SH668]|uniref:glutathione peroxidase n=1 Tax=Planctomicrobium sp. SH668 TaxID=3448126 RepID=UPI003F5BB23D